MKYHAIVLCAFLCRISEASKADVLASLRAQKISEEAQRLSGESLVEYLNKNQNLFEAAITPASHGYKHKLMDLKFIGQKGNIVVEDEKDFGDDIPESFDGRVHWANCSSLWYIPDQANCGSCWAVASAAAMSDRLCIASKGAKQVHLSANDILSCCEDCGQGCRGGLAIEAWNFLIDNGVVTGGDYGSKDCCRPYPLHPCGHHGNDTYYGECDGTASTPKCKKRCQSGYRKSYTMDKFYGKYAYQLPNSVIAIQKEIMKNGPVVGSFTVFEDFSLYVKGIYKHTAGKIDGAHSVKIIGWGKEGDTPYWIIANSWNDDWGENGYFRMIRGINECGIEDTVIAGIVRA